MKNRMQQKGEQGLMHLFGTETVKSSLLSKAVMNMLGVTKTRHLYAATSGVESADFVDNVLKRLGIDFVCSEEDRTRIPKDEAFVVVSNHPYGGLDGLILMSLMLRERPDFRIMVNYLLQHFPEIQDHAIAVDPFDAKGSNAINLKGIRQSLALLKAGVPVGIFPAGEVSAFQLNRFSVTDKMWHPVVGKLILKSGVKVVPVHFSGQNSILFQLLGMIHPQLRTAKLPSELFNKSQPIRVRIGKPIAPTLLKSFADSNQMLRFLRTKTYALGSKLDVKSFYHLPPSRFEAEPVIPSVSTKELAEDIVALQKSGYEICTHNEFNVFIAPPVQMPHIMREISRLREITFRRVGEGTNRAADTDEFDLLYKHLFVWDSKHQRIAGAYRLGEGKKLFERYGRRGFYLNKLFKFKKEFYDVMQEAVELGRSFIVEEYQRSPYLLLLLWKGINQFVADNPGYRYLIGPVSISNSFSALSKDLMVAYIKRHHYDAKLARMVEPRKQFVYASRGEEKHMLDVDVHDIRMLDQLVGSFENDAFKLPVLLKKYLSQNARIIAFNIDPDFSNSLDGLLVLNLERVPQATFDMLGKAGS